MHDFVEAFCRLGHGMICRLASVDIDTLRSTPPAIDFDDCRVISVIMFSRMTEQCLYPTSRKESKQIMIQYQEDKVLMQVAFICPS